MSFGIFCIALGDKIGLLLDGGGAIGTVGWALIGCHRWPMFIGIRFISCSLFLIFHALSWLQTKAIGIIVSQKVLTCSYFTYYNNYMANVLSTDNKSRSSSLCREEFNIRSIERVTGVHRDTVMRLGVKVGQGCTALMDAKMRSLDCYRLEMDEIWGFVGKKIVTFALMMTRSLEMSGRFVPSMPIRSSFRRSASARIAT